ncbi:type II 3-dehydroquinate dehydratase [Jiella endophytica]|uniref:3-dehydroquinate dehydratase n=1 Tax=Jiella endophytica TaxID=2558362 RepID=A0A4Y8R939_9HYPH|nr:type II 3-dehydroquinate dehydratase [Jiella endophytica]TFF18069.1 type II 3-dehydroquinate dehydratase [Jiella endophytica]
MATIFCIHGPNLNLLGKRQPEVYGFETLADIEARLQPLAGELGHDLRCLQSNREYEIIDWIHEARDKTAAIIINPGAFSHTSVAILDALNAYDGVVLEVHISNIHKRESFRHHSFVSGRAEGVIAGFGTRGYDFALTRAAELIAAKA